VGRRLVALASGLAVVLPLPLVSRARADQTPVSPLAPAATVRAGAAPRLALPATLRLTTFRELGLAGVNLRLQFPIPLSPYLEGRLGDGVSEARPDGALMIPGTHVGVSGSAAAGWQYLRGVDLGFDVHRFRGGYVSVAVGWLRSSWPVGGFDERDRLVSRKVWSDGLLFKLGVSF
jgi:hypothetical protein